MTVTVLDLILFKIIFLTDWKLVIPVFSVCLKLPSEKMPKKSEQLLKYLKYDYGP